MIAAPDHARAARSEEVRALLASLCAPLQAERVPLADALGRVLREPVDAPEDQPGFDRSSVDGYAVRMDDTSTSVRVIEEIRAGDWKAGPVRPGEAVRIATGGALPCDGLQVVMKEDVEVQGTRAQLVRREAGRNVRLRGEEARAGQVLVEPGTLLSPGALALLASVGHTRPCVTRRPRVLHLATGNEIVAPDQVPPPGQIRDSNSTLVRSFLLQWNIEPRQLRVAEDAEATESALADAGDGADLVLISGGASVGEHDFTRRLLERLGYTLHVSKTQTRPGKPLIIAQRDQTVAFGLPGNPLAHFVCLALYVRTALDAFSGRPAESPVQRGVLTAELRADANARETFWPARRRLISGAPALTPLRWTSSGDLTALATANALIRVRAGTAELTQGSEVEFISTFPTP